MAPNEEYRQSRSNILILLRILVPACLYFVIFYDSTVPQHFQTSGTKRSLHRQLRRKERTRLVLRGFNDPKSTSPRTISDGGGKNFDLPLVVGMRGGHTADGTSQLLPACTLENVGLGRWTYEHIATSAKNNFAFNEAIVSTAEWTPLHCLLPELDWRPEPVRSCFAEKKIRNVIIMGGSTSTYMAMDFLHWMKGKYDTVDFHSKMRNGGAVDSGLTITGIHKKEANPGAYQSFLQESKFFEDTLVLFNSGLWDMRMNDLGQYAQDVGDLADAFAWYKEEHPSNHVIWRSSGTPNWDRLDIEVDGARARERLLNPDAVLVYNAVASESMQSRGIEVFDDAAMVLGRPEETRGPTDGLHPSSHMNTELMKILLSVFCQK